MDLQQGNEEYNCIPSTIPPQAPGPKRAPRIIQIILVGIVCFVLGQFVSFAGWIDLFGFPRYYESGQTISAAELASRVREVSRLLDSNALYDFEVDSATKTTIDAMLASSGDKNAQYFTEDYYLEYLQYTSGSYVGIGVQITTIGDYQVIAGVYEGSPAEEAGVLPGDIFVSIDGQTDFSTSEEVVQLIARDEGETVEITWLRPTSESLENLIESTVTTSEDSEADSETDSETSTDSDTSDSSDASNSADASQELDDSQELQLDGEIITTTIEYRQFDITNLEYEMIDDVGYIYLMSFNMQAAEDVKEALEDLMSQGATAIVLDLRDNAGGYVDQAIEIVSMFVEEGSVIQIETADAITTVEVTGDFICDLPLAVIVNENSASASEITAAALQDHGRAILVGTQTYGKGTMQTLTPLSFGGAVKYTIAEFYSPLGHDINEVGITPDVVVEATDQTIQSLSEDPQVLAAIESIK